MPRLRIEREDHQVKHDVRTSRDEGGRGLIGDPQRHSIGRADEGLDSRRSTCRSRWQCRSSGSQDDAICQGHPSDGNGCRLECGAGCDCLISDWPSIGCPREGIA
ncbi:MAG: hypothetical protein WC977_01855 [Anaerovoracaceae bacterium]